MRMHPKDGIACLCVPAAVAQFAALLAMLGVASFCTMVARPIWNVFAQNLFRKSIGSMSGGLPMLSGGQGFEQADR